MMVISLILSIGLPIVLSINIVKYQRASLKSVLVGALVFFVSQIVLRIPLLRLLSGTYWFTTLSYNLLLYGLFLAITAGIFEETGRYIGYKTLLKDRLDWKNGVAFGIGHGGIEAILLLGMTYVNNIYYSIAINKGTFDSDILPKLPSATASYIRNALVNTDPHLFLVAGFERVFAMSAHIGFSLVVLYGVKFKKPIYLLYAILLHGLLNAPVAFGIQNILIIEGYIFIFALVSLYFTIKSRALFD
jgi:uncharacterized membrane protein YhfC